MKLLVITREWVDGSLKVKWLLYKHEGLSSGPQHSHESQE